MNISSNTILIVEDEAQIRKFLRLSLEADGFIVEETRLGEEGLSLCATVQPQLVILDLGLPDIDGQDIICRLREWSQVPIIVLSVRASKMEKVLALNMGANDYVTKPFGISELIARIRVVLRNSVGKVSTPKIFESAGLRIDLAQRDVSIDGESVYLTKKVTTRALPAQANTLPEPFEWQ